MKIETGIIIIKNNKAWAETYNDGRSSSCGWVNIEDASIFEPEFIKKPEDVTYVGSPYVKELSKAQLKKIKRTTVIEFLEE